jgi:two-component system OmpR family sensor kinase
VSNVKRSRVKQGPRNSHDPDARAVHRAAVAVGIQITVASGILVLGVLVAAFVFVFEHIPRSSFIDINRHHETTIDVGVVDLLSAGVLIGVVAIVLAATLSLFATRRAVRPLGDALRLQRNFVADASHELRTPLAVLDARLQLLQRGLPTADPTASVVAELRHDTKTLIDIVNDLLASAELGGHGNTEPVEVNPIVALAVNSMRLIAAEKEVTVVVRDSARVSTMIPAASIHRCIVALLDNALDFAPRHSTITVSVSARGTTAPGKSARGTTAPGNSAPGKSAHGKRAHGMARLAVSDQGEGIHGIDPARIFDRFARSELAAGTTRTGFGIGLSLVREVVVRAGGHAAVSYTGSSGTEIELLIPLAR